MNNPATKETHSSLTAYLEQHTDNEDRVLQKLYRETYLKAINPRMISGHLQGNLLSLISKLVSPQHILEIGTFTGYSSICLAKGLKEGGLVHTIEQDDELENIITNYIDASGNKEKIRLHIGNALTIIPSLPYQFDMVFIDADKKQYLDYYKAILPLLNQGGVILVDNVLWDNKVLKKAATDDEETQSIQVFNAYVAQDKSVEKVILPIRDGLFLIRKR